jgi:uncharacterized phage protein (TIGR02220 family)
MDSEKINEPWLQFYLFDWLAQTRGCSLAAKGLAIDMICLMHQHGQPYGHLTTATGSAVSEERLLKLAKCGLKELRTCIDELIDEEVLRKTAEGVLWSPWLVRMHHYRNKKRLAGQASAAKRAGNPVGTPARTGVGTPARTGVGTPARTGVGTPVPPDARTPVQTGDRTQWNLDSGDLESGPSDFSPVPNSILDFKAAQALLAYLNEKASADFRENPGDLQEIAGRLHESGGDVAAVKIMIDRQCAQWKADPKMANYLRPSTLFEPVKFHQYFGQRNLPVATSIGQPDGVVRVNVAAINGRLMQIKQRLPEIENSPNQQDIQERRALLRERDVLLEQQKKAAGQ